MNTLEVPILVSVVEPKVMVGLEKDPVTKTFPLASAFTAHPSSPQIPSALFAQSTLPVASYLAR